MDFAQTRELIHLRYELRRLLAEGRREEARPLLARLRQLAAEDERQKAEILPEIERWECRFALLAPG